MEPQHHASDSGRELANNRRYSVIIGIKPLKVTSTPLRGLHSDPDHDVS